MYTPILHGPVVAHLGPGPVLAFHLGMYELTGAGVRKIWYSLWYICEFFVPILSYMMAKHNSITSLDFPILTWGQGDMQLRKFLFRGITWGILRLRILSPLSRIIRMDVVCHGYYWKLTLTCRYLELLSVPQVRALPWQSCYPAKDGKHGYYSRDDDILHTFTGQMNDLPE